MEVTVALSDRWHHFSRKKNNITDCGTDKYQAMEPNLLAILSGKAAAGV